MLRSFSILFFLINIIVGNVYAQSIERFNSFHYNVNEGMLQSSVQDLAFDENNFCWISYTNGLQKFDGEEFISIPIQDGLPEDSDLGLFKTKSGSYYFLIKME